jgi:hypothetical protein
MNRAQFYSEAGATLLLILQPDDREGDIAETPRAGKQLCLARLAFITGSGDSAGRWVVTPRRLSPAGDEVCDLGTVPPFFFKSARCPHIVRGRKSFLVEGGQVQVLFWGLASSHAGSELELWLGSEPRKK